jgi:hypothetical protein
MDGDMILDNDKITTIYKQYLEVLYQEGEIANFNNINNPDMQGVDCQIYLGEHYNTYT